MVAALGGNDYFPPPMAFRSLSSLLCATLLLLAPLCLAACNFEGKGDPPPKGLLYYPTALTLSADDRFLFVVNSNFDRRYRAGSVQAYDLDHVAEAVDAQCPKKKLGIDCEIDPASLVHSEVLIGSLARAAALNSDGTRLTIPTQADGALSYVDVGVSEEMAGELACGGHRTCGSDYVRGLDKGESERSLVLPADPVAITSVSLQALAGGDAAANTGDATLVVHRNGKVSLFLDVEGKPTLVHVLEGLSGNVTGIDFDSESGLFHVTSQQLASSTGPKFLQRVGVALHSETQKSYLFSAGSTTLRGIDSGQDTWAVAFQVTPDVDEALVLTRRPDALLQVRMADDGLSADVRNIVEVGGGAARMVTGTVMSPEGPRALAVVSCISERRVFVVDAISGDVLSVVPSFSGPFVMAMDSKRARVYVADFRSSTIRILDLEPVLRRESARVLATLGQPRYVQELK